MRLFPRPEGESLVSWYNAGVGMIWPVVQLSTRRNWQGVENLGRPGDGMVVAANHISWLDPFVLAQFLNDNGRSPRFLAKASLFDVPLGGDVLKGANQIPVYRETADATNALSAAIEAVREGESIVIYPEGTITRDPAIWPMTAKTGAARIALASRMPLVPVAQWGAQDVMRPYKLEARFWPPKTMTFRAGEPVDLTDLYDEPMDAQVLAVATDRLMDAITAMLADIRGETPPDGRFDAKSGTYVPTTGGVLSRDD